MNINNLKKYDMVMINDNSEWNGRIGLVDFNDKGIVGIITVENPCEHYIVGIWNANNIERIEI